MTLSNLKCNGFLCKSLALWLMLYKKLTCAGRDLHKFFLFDVLYVIDKLILNCYTNLGEENDNNFM